MKTSLRIGLAQINTTVGDLASNAKKILRFAREAARQDCDLTVFPEMALTGYPAEDLLLRPHFIKDNARVLKNLKSQLPVSMSTVIGFADGRDAGELYNAASCFVGRRWVGTYRKMCLPNYGVFDEKRYFKSGREAFILRRGPLKLGISICEDLWSPDNACIRALKLAGVHCILNLSASPYHFEKSKEREMIFKKRARELRAAVACANAVGGQDELVFDGSSLLIDAGGAVIQRAKRFAEDLLIEDLTFTASRTPKKAKALFKSCRIVTLPNSISRKPKNILPAREPFAQPRHAVEEIYHALCLGTHDYVKKNGFSRAVIGLSGGVDSALVATIAVDALGPDQVIGVTMPSTFSSKGTRNDAHRLAHQLGIEMHDIRIDPIRSSFDGALRTLFKGLPKNAAEENLQARIRGSLLMALSNKHNYLVLTTGNKSEMATGYCTLYGDMAGGFAVIKDVPKTVVYKLCEYRNQIAGHTLIPESILKRAPSAELRPGQKDTDALPPYATLDPILEAYITHNLPPSRIHVKGASQKTVFEVIRMVDRNEYKRRQGPVGVKITPRAFGRDRRMPITNRYVSLAR